MGLLYLLLLVPSVSIGTDVDCFFTGGDNGGGSDSGGDSGSGSGSGKDSNHDGMMIKYCRGNKLKILIVCSQSSIISPQIKSNHTPLPCLD